MTERIISGFGARATAEEVTASIDLRGKRAIVTGGASGIGVDTAQNLAARGAAVTLAVRDVATGESVAARIREANANAQVEVRALELTDPASIAAFTQAWQGPLDLLINNAGVMALQELTRTSEGWEMQFATNHLGHFRLTIGLHRALAAADGARVVSLSSSGHLFSPVVFDDIHFRFRPYDPVLAYAQSKTAVIQFAVAASERWAADGITVNAVNPGAIATPLQRHVGGRLRTPVHLQKNTSQGAATTLFAATSPLVAGIGGRYFNDNSEAVRTAERSTDVAVLSAQVADYALDPDNASRLWNYSEGLTR